MDKNHPMQVDAAKEMVRYWLESPYTQRLLDKLMKDHPDTNGVYCAYTQAFDNPGKQTKLNAKTDVPGGIIYPTSRNLAVATYINSQFLLNVKPNPSESEVNPETGWLLDKEQVPEYKDADIVAVSPTFYLGYFKGYGKLFVNWQQLCGGLPYLTWDPYKGFLTRDMLKNPDIVDELQPGTAVALAEALFYELERSETGYGKVRETFYEPYLPSTLLDLNVKVNFDKANKILEENGYPILPFSIDKSKMATSVRYMSLVLAQGRIRDDQDVLWYTGNHHFNWGGGEFNRLGVQSYTSNEVGKTFLWPKDNLPPYAPAVLNSDINDGLFSYAAIPMAMTSYTFWWRFLVSRGYKRPDDADFKTGKGTVLDLMFGLDLPNFRPDQAQAQPLAFSEGEGQLYGGYTDGVYPNQYGTMLANPDRMASVVRELERKVLIDDDRFDNIDNQFVADHVLAGGPMIPALMFHLNPKGAVIYADWKPITSPPDVVMFDATAEDDTVTESYETVDGETVDTQEHGADYIGITNGRISWPGIGSFGNTLRMGGGFVHTRSGNELGETMYGPENSAGGRWQYGGPVFVELTDIEVDRHRLPFPFRRFGKTYVNPKTGRYTLDETVIARLNQDLHSPNPNTDINNLLTDFGAYTTCAPYADTRVEDVPNDVFRLSAAWYCLKNLGPSKGDIGWVHLIGYGDEYHNWAAAEDVLIAQGFGQAILQSTTLLMGNMVDNPEALDKLDLADWLKQDQTDLKNAAKDGKAVYDPHAPYLGLYWVPTYHVPVFYFALNPVVQFRAAGLVLSNDMLTKPGSEDEIYPSPLGMSVLTQTTYAEFFPSILRDNVPRDYNQAPVSNMLLFWNYWFYGGGKRVINGPDWDEFYKQFRDAMENSDAVAQRLQSEPYWYTVNVDKMIGEMGFTKKTYPLALIEPRIHSDKVGQYGDKFTGSVLSYLAPFWLLRDYNVDAFSDGTTHYFRVSPTYLPENYYRKFDSEHLPKYYPAYSQPYRLAPPAVEIQAVADEAGVCLPWPTLEEGECTVGVFYDKNNEENIYYPYMEKDYDYLNKDVTNWVQSHKNGNVEFTHKPKKLDNLCETSVFYQVQKKFGNDVAQRLWKVANMLAFNDPKVLDNLPQFKCSSNEDYIATYRPAPWNTPTLYQMLHDGKLGGLHNAPEAWNRDPNMVWIIFRDHQKRIFDDYYFIIGYDPFYESYKATSSSSTK